MKRGMKRGMREYESPAGAKLGLNQRCMQAFDMLTQ